MRKSADTKAIETLDTRTLKEIRQGKKEENRKLIGTQKPLKESFAVVTIVNIFENAGKKGDLVRVRDSRGLLKVIDKDEIELE